VLVEDVCLDVDRSLAVRIGHVAVLLRERFGIAVLREPMRR